MCIRVIHHFSRERIIQTQELKKVLPWSAFINPLICNHDATIEDSIHFQDDSSSNAWSISFRFFLLKPIKWKGPFIHAEDSFLTTQVKAL